MFLSEFLRIAKWKLKLFVFLPKAKQLLSRMMNHEANQVTLLKQVKQVIKQHIITFNSFNVPTKEILTKILDHTWNRLVSSEQCFWGVTGITTILILNIWNIFHGYWLIFLIWSTLVLSLTFNWTLRYIVAELCKQVKPGLSLLVIKV